MLEDQPNRAGVRLGTLEALTAAVGELLGAFSAQGCANYFANAGYGQT